MQQALQIVATPPSESKHQKKRRCTFAARCFLAGIVIAPLRLLACAPFLPEQILTNPQVILRTPVGDFAQEVEALTPADGAPTLPAGLVRLAPQAAVGYESATGANTAAPVRTELTELSDALDHADVPAPQREKILTAYATFRGGMVREPISVSPGDEHSAIRFDLRAREMRKEPVPSTPAISALPSILAEGLPAEWDDYLTGAAAFWSNDLTGARQAWERLLARPPAERLYCSTWAAYMLARILDDPAVAPEENARRYQRVRELRAAGCRDLFNLASASLGWEAHLALDRHDCATAIRLYYLQAITSEDSFGQIGGSLRAVVGEVLPVAIPDANPDPAVVAAAAADPFLRRIVTLYLACDRSFDDSDEVLRPGVPAPASVDQQPWRQMEDAWLAALTTSGVTSAPEATHIAWAAYEKGDYIHASAWLDKAPAKDGLALWLRAKLALRAGKTDVAAAFFAQAVHSYPAETKDLSNALDDQLSVAIDANAFRTSQCQTDFGIISLAQGDYAQALTALLRSGFWLDAAYVAERVMTVDELQAYVRTNFPQEPPAVESASENVAPPTNAFAVQRSPLQIIQDNLSSHQSTNPAATSTRYLLARRLARAGRYAEARGFYPAALLPKFDEYAAARKLGDSAKQPAVKRADALWRAARIERWLGMELFGSEDDPDWFVVGGNFDLNDHYLEARLSLPQPRVIEWSRGQPPDPASTPAPPFVPPVSAAEKQRLGRSHVEPEKRYHYRYLAAELAWRAAALMPDQQDQTALVLAYGGRWLQSVDAAKAADKFYLAILRRCGKTDLGRQADQAGMIPEITDEDF